MVYFGYHLVKAHVQTVQNMYGKGGQGVCKAELRPPEVDPYFERKKIALGGVTKSLQAAILTLEQNPSTGLGIIPKRYHFFSASLRQLAPVVVIHKKWISWRKEYMVEVNFLCGQHAGEEYRAEERENIRLPKHEIYYFYSCKFSFYLCVWYFERSNSSNGLYLWIKCSSCLCFQSMQMCILRKF